MTALVRRGGSNGCVTGIAAVLSSVTFLEDASPVTRDMQYCLACTSRSDPRNRPHIITQHALTSIPPHHSHSTINHVISFPVLFSPAIQSHSVPIFAPLCQSMLHSISHNISLPRTPFPPTQSPVRTNTKNTTITILPSPTRLPPSLGFHYTSKNH